MNTTKRAKRVHPMEMRERIGDTLRGRAKTDKHRAAMHASKTVNRADDPERWQIEFNAYLKRLDALRAIGE